MLVNQSKDLNQVFEYNPEIKRNFFSVLDKFSKRKVFTPEVCYLMKVELESLFSSYEIKAKIDVKSNIDGDGRLSVDFFEGIPQLPEPEPEVSSSLESMPQISDLVGSSSGSSSS